MLFSRQNALTQHQRLYRRHVSSTTRIVAKENLPATAYKPEVVEKNKYETWEKNGLFKARNTWKQKSFSMILPPPNVTGKLHLGHTLACTIQDVIVRRMRSMGHNVLWMPGTDHAGIATQGVVEKHLRVQNISRNELGREKFNKEVWKWKEKYGNTISKQLRTLGYSLDWSREKFTMDPKHTKAVNAAFIKLFQQGLIYRRKALVNWCNALKSTVSDIEVENIALKGPTDLVVHGYDKPVKFGLLYSFAYKVFDGNEEIVVSTTMPETMLGDTAIAVHPSDRRYQHLIGKEVLHPFRNETIPIISDNFVDMQFGTGAVKITPAHSKVDYDVAKHHNLPLIQVIDEDGLMKNCGHFDKQKRYDCRKELLNILEVLDLLRDMQPHPMNLPTCSRTGDVITHLPKEQWFLYCKDLNKKAEEVVRNGKLKIEPEKFVKHWFNWTADNRDWCISRQLWWGHQIPAYKCTFEKNIVWIAAEDEKSAKIEASKYLRSVPEDINVERDTDVLDTWFSSGIYPFASLGWPDDVHSPDYRLFLPLSLMATGHDILGFWVHRMVTLGLKLTGTLPFNKVLLHGIICDSKGAKMSKSKGNVIDPVDVINGISIGELWEKAVDMHRNGVLTKEELEKALQYHKQNFKNTNGIPECGVDALRFTLLSQDIKAHFVSFDVVLCHSNKLFCNKIWQSIKYTQLSFEKLNNLEEEITRDDLTYFDRWILSKLSNMVDVVNESMDNYDFHVATKALRTLIYNEFCDVYIEATKPGFSHDNEKISYAHAHTLSAVLNTSLRCLAPYMVYLTDEVIPKIPAFEKNIIHNFTDEKSNYYEFPKSEDFQHWRDDNLDKRVDNLLNSVTVVRELKGLYGIGNKKSPIVIKTKDDTLLTDLKENNTVVLNLTRSSDLQFNENPDKKYVKGLLDKNTEISVELIGDNVENTILETRAKLQNRIKKMEENLAKLETKYSSDRYLATVPEWTQASDREKLETKQNELKLLLRLI